MDHQNPFPFVLSRQVPHAPAAVFAAWTALWYRVLGKLLIDSKFIWDRKGS